MKKVILRLIVAFASLPYPLISQGLKSEQILNAGISKYKSLSNEEVNYLTTNYSRPDLLEKITSWEKDSGIKLSKNAYYEIIAEFNVSELSLQKYANQEGLNIDIVTIRSTGLEMLPRHLSNVIQYDTLNELVCLWTWGLPSFRKFFSSEYYRVSPDKIRSPKMNSYGPVRANEYGVVEIECNVDGEIFIDRQPQDMYASAKLVVAVGNKEFQIKKQGYATCNQQIMIRKGRKEKIKCELKTP